MSVCIPHLETLPQLRLAVETLRWQSVRPYFIIIDTGSSPATCEELERLRCEDLEIHYLRSNGFFHASEPVAVALDFGHAICHTEYLYHTHSDVFAMRRDWLEWLLVRCSADFPAVGYEMSERSGTDEWRGTLSHTATMLHMVTMRRIRQSWSMQRWYEVHGVPPASVAAWPDTEAGLRMSLDEAGITPVFVDEVTCPGARHERNYQRDTDCNVDHVRSFASMSLYGQIGKLPQLEWMASAMASARFRAGLWREETLRAVGRGQEVPE